MQKPYKIKFAVIILAIGLYWYIFFNFMPSACIFKNITGVPCPGCGLTRSGVALLKGQWQKSLYFHALLLPVLSLMGLSVIGVLQKIKSKYLWAMVFIVFAYYVIRMIMFFPNQAPLDYQENNLINFLFKLIHKP